MRVLDGLITLLAVLIGLLIVTGGLHYMSPSLKLELSQVDAFAWTLLVCVLLRFKLTSKLLPPRLEKIAQSGFAASERRPKLVLGVAVALYVGLMTWMSAWRFDSFHASAFDLSFVEQALWSTTRIGFLHTSLGKGQSYLGEHFSPILGLVAVVYRIWSSPFFLFFIQSLILASGAPLVYKLARSRGLSRGLSAALGLCLLLYQPLRAANHFDFREDNLFVPLFLGLLLALERKRWSLFWTLTFVIWTVKENAPLFTGLLGGTMLVEGLWIRGRNQSLLDNSRPLTEASAQNRSAGIQGFFLGVLSLVVFFYINTKVTPYFAGSDGETMAAKRLRHLGANNTEIIAFLIAHPFGFAARLFEPLLQKQALKYVLNVTVPFIVFFSSAPLLSIVVASGLLMNLMVNQPTIGFHYECILIPFLFQILILGLSKKPQWKKSAHATLLLIAFLLFFGRSPVDALRRYQPTERDRFVAERLKTIPAEASVATQSVLHPHLTHRRDTFLFSPSRSPAEYVVADLSSERDRYATPNLESDLARLESLGYKVVFDERDLKIWKK